MQGRISFVRQDRGTRPGFEPWLSTNVSLRPSHKESEIFTVEEAAMCNLKRRGLWNMLLSNAR